MVISGVLMLAALSSTNTSILDTAKMINEFLWEQEYIPESDQATLPLSEYTHFEISTILRAMTIRRLHGVMSDGYPMPWLEEILKDKAIPREDRLWLDRRLRSAIAQNTNTFYNTSGDPIHLEADGCFPGETYWRENMIVDPAGMNAPQDLARPTGMEGCDIGLIMNPYGRKIGEIAVALPRGVFTSRDASTAILVSGANSIYSQNEQPYACFMRLDGSFTEFPLSNIGTYDAAISANGEIAAFSLQRTHDSESHTYSGDDHVRDIEIFDGQGHFLRYIDSPVNLDYNNSCFVQITEDGHYLCRWGEGVAVCLVDCSSGEVRIMPESEGNCYTDLYLFSPDGRFLALSGRTEERIYNIEEQTTSMLQPEIQRECGSYASRVCSSSDALFASVTRFRPITPISVILFEDTPIDTVFLMDARPISEFSPNGFFVITNLIDAADGAPHPAAGAPPGMFNLPLIVRMIRGVE